MKHKFKKAQSTAEYAILISLVIAAAMGISAEVKKALQARIHNEAMVLSQGQTYEPVQGNKITTNQVQNRVKNENYVAANQPNAVWQRQQDNAQADFGSVEIK
jgi:hypothetical protein